MLRARVPDKYSEIPMPIQGVNLRDPAHLLEPGECQLLQHALFDGSIKMIPGTTRLTPSALTASSRIRGGHRFYRQDGSKRRVVAYGSTISEINDAGNESVITTAMTADKITYFSTWPILDRCYATNGSDNPLYYTGSSSGTLLGTNIPTPLSPLVPILDRLMCVTSNGIERTDARDDTVWSFDSAWATKRPQRPGRFTAIHPFNMKDSGLLYPGLLCFQANAYYLLTGTDFGQDVTASTASTDEDSAIQMLDPSIGTSSPQSICTVPGVGIFWVTSDLNVYWLPEGSLKGLFIGDKLQSRCATAGLNDTNLAAIDQVWMIYHDRKLLLGFPSGVKTYPDTQYWLDLRYLTAGDPKGSVWYGPHTVNSWGCVWREDQGGDLTLMAGEGNAATGAYVYKGYQAASVGHTVGSSTVLPTMLYADRHTGYDGGSSMKYARDARFTATWSGGTAKSGMMDLGGQIAFRQPLTAWGNG